MKPGSSPALARNPGPVPLLPAHFPVLSDPGPAMSEGEATRAAGWPLGGRNRDCIQPMQAGSGRGSQASRPQQQSEEISELPPGWRPEARAGLGWPRWLRPLRSLFLASEASPPPPSSSHSSLPTCLRTAASSSSTFQLKELVSAPTTPFVEEAAQGLKRRRREYVLLSSWPYLQPVEVGAVLSLFSLPETQISSGRSPEEASLISSPSSELLGENDGLAAPTPPLLVPRQEGPLCAEVHTRRKHQLHSSFKNN